MSQTMGRPVLRSRAPVRIDLAGGWTDVPPFSTEVGGAVVNAAITRYTYASLIPRDDARIRIVSADFAGMTPRSARTSQTASSTSSQRPYLAASVQRALISGRA